MLPLPPSFPPVNPLQSGFSILHSENCSCVGLWGPVVSKCNGCLSITTAIDSSQNSKYLSNSIWNTCLSLCGNHFITFCLYSFSLLPHLWLFVSTLGPFTLWFSSRIVSLPLPIPHTNTHGSGIHSCNTRDHGLMTLDFLSLAQTIPLNFRFAFLSS